MTPSLLARIPALNALSPDLPAYHWPTGVVAFAFGCASLPLETFRSLDGSLVYPRSVLPNSPFEVEGALSLVRALSLVDGVSVSDDA